MRCIFHLTRIGQDYGSLIQIDNQWYVWLIFKAEYFTPEERLSYDIFVNIVSLHDNLYADFCICKRSPGPSKCQYMIHVHRIDQPLQECWKKYPKDLIPIFPRVIHKTSSISDDRWALLIASSVTEYVNNAINKWKSICLHISQVSGMLLFCLEKMVLSTQKNINIKIFWLIQRWRQDWRTSIPEVLT